MSDFNFEGGAPSQDSGSSYQPSDSSSSSYGSDSGYGSQSDSSYGQGASDQDSQTYDVTINGQTQKVPLSELLKGYSRHSDYTQKTQSLAERERVYQSQMQQYESALNEIKGFLEDPERVSQYYQQIQQQYQTQQMAPDEFVTAQQAQMLLQQQLGQFQATQQQQLMELQHNIEVQNLTGQYTPQVEHKISELKGRFPALNSPRTERMLRMETLNRQPGSLQEAMQVMENVAREINSDLSSILKQGGAPPLNPQLANGIEPRGGQGLMPQPQGNFKKVNDINLRNLVIQDLMNADPGQRSR